MAVGGTRTEGGDTVTVAIKSPNGLILRVFRMEDVQEPVMGGGWRTVKAAVETGERYMLAGYAAPYGEAPRVPVVGGYAINHNVPSDIWDVWLAQNKDSMLVKSGLIFAYAKPADAEAKAKDGAKIRNGLEPMSREEYDGGGNVIPSTVDPRQPGRIAREKRVA